jgi:hypothetical protein
MLRMNIAAPKIPRDPLHRQYENLQIVNQTSTVHRALDVKPEAFVSIFPWKQMLKQSMPWDKKKISGKVVSLAHEVVSGL